MAMPIPIPYRLMNNGFQRKPALGEGVVKIVVVGERHVGKTSFIQKYYYDHEPDGTNSYFGTRWYKCEFTGEGHHWRTALFEIPGGADSILEQRTPLYEGVKVFVFMYAVDDPMSLQRIKDKWLPELRDIILSKNIPAVLVGNKKDLRGDRQVIEKLALDDQEPVTNGQGREFLNYGEIVHFVEISSKDLDDVNRAFEIIFSFIVHGA